VTHPVVVAQLDAYLDGELAAPDAGELEAHLRVCPECARLEQRRRTLGAALREHLPRYEAPDTLRARVRAGLRKETTPVRAVRRGPMAWRALSVAASLAVVAVGSWQLALQRAQGEALADQVVASHLRSLMAGHLADVPSSDQHTVKPWFDGKLDFAPPVTDLTKQGFPLVGGRLDYIGRKAVAAVVYQRRQHFLNLFVWPATDSADSGNTMMTRQGYNVIGWTQAGMRFWLVSDLNLSELQQFADVVQHPS